MAPQVESYKEPKSPKSKRKSPPDVDALIAAQVPETRWKSAQRRPCGPPQPPHLNHLNPPAQHLKKQSTRVATLIGQGYARWDEAATERVLGTWDVVFSKAKLIDEKGTQWYVACKGTLEDLEKDKRLFPPSEDPSERRGTFCTGGKIQH
eukprot:3910080-Pyramimonas_sp.AAC.1